MKLQLAKGVRDFDPVDKMRRDEVVLTLKDIFERSGFSPIETPVFERFDVLSSKYAGGAEILKETFRFKDQGGRELALRYDLTVPMCRYVGMNLKELKLPFKRYQIGQVFRDGPIKLGRYREFYQCDIDIVGCKGILAEVQLIEVAYQAFLRLGIDVEIRINNRKLMDGFLSECGVAKDRMIDSILAIDKLEKVGEKLVRQELSEKGIDSSVIDKVFSYLGAKSLDDFSFDNEGKTELEELFSYLDSIGIDFRFDPSLARGLGYYTGSVFEIFFKDGKIKSACSGGGRYDNMIGDFIGSKEKIPAVGISFGLEVISDYLNLNGPEEKKTITEVFIIPIGTTSECLKIATELRKKGIRTDIDIMGRGISKNLNYANTLGIPFVMIIGEDEIKAGKVKVKDMKSGEERMINAKDFRI